MRVLSDRSTDGVGELTAEAIVGYKMLRERFVSHVKLDRPRLAIDVAFVSGPLDALENRWRFHPLPDGSTDIEFFLRFELRNPILRAVMSASFDRAAGLIMDGFARRALERFPVVG
jgi:coenzyme Q-binding protein COQ10